MGPLELMFHVSHYVLGLMELQLHFSLVVFLSIVFLFFLKKFLKKSEANGKLPPGPPKLPVIGHIHLLAGKPAQTAMADLAKKYGPIIHLQLGQVSTVFISSAQLAKDVFKMLDLNFDRPALLSPEILAYDYKDIAFAPYGPYWREMRKLCTLELLSVKKVRSFHGIREGECWNMVDSVRESCGTGRKVNMRQMVTRLVNMMISRAMFGEKCHQEEVLDMVREVIVVSGGFNISDLFPSLKFLEILTGTRPMLLKLHKKFDRMFDKIIALHLEKREIPRGEGNNDNEDNEDLLDVLIRLQDDASLENTFTTENIKAVTMDMFMAGTDTSSVTIVWAMSELMRNPRVMEKAQAELRQAFKGKENIYESDIQELSYLKLVIKEALRLHPPIPLLIPRECREECVLGGYTIPVKTRVLIDAKTISRDPNYWTDPESFVPERFIDHNSNNMVGVEFEYFPFGAGRRKCPGISMGLANVELPLAMLLYHFDWQLPDGRKYAEDLDMSELLGVTCQRKNDLVLVPIPYHTQVS